MNYECLRLGSVVTQEMLLMGHILSHVYYSRAGSYKSDCSMFIMGNMMDNINFPDY